MATVRDGHSFNAGHLRVLCLEFSSFSRSIILEVLRGIGCRNDFINFSTLQNILDLDDVFGDADIILYSHETGKDVDFDGLTALRRLDHKEVSELPIIILSSLATRSFIQKSRDVGIDEIVLRPISPLQLERKLRQLVESPRAFVTSTNYIGPCRRRKENRNYSGSRRRLSDYEKKINVAITAKEGADTLATAVSELREACAALSTERLGLIARVRQTADKTAELARVTGDKALEKTAAAMKQYLDGVGSQNTLETHVLETGINALTQLAVLPDSYVGARDSVAQLMSIAVRKKLMTYERRQNAENNPDRLLDKINQNVHVDLDDDIPSPPVRKSRQLKA